MKQKCSTILKVFTALVLAVLMMVGSVSGVVGAVVEQADNSVGSGSDVLIEGAKSCATFAVPAAEDEDDDITVEPKFNADLAGTGAEADLAGTGSDDSYMGDPYSIDWLYLKGTWESSATNSNVGGNYSSTWNSTSNLGKNSGNSDEYYAELTLASDTEFWFGMQAGWNNHDGNYYGQYGTGDWIGASASANCGIKKNGGNIPLVTIHADSGYVTVKFYINVKTCRVYVTQTAKSIGAPKLSGTPGSWNAYGSATAMTASGDGVYTYTYSNVAARNGSGSSDSDRYRFTILRVADWNRDYRFDSGITVKTNTSSTIVDKGKVDQDGQCAWFKLNAQSDVVVTWNRKSKTVTIDTVSTTTYTVVGAYGTSGSSTAGFFGTAWAPTASANDLTYNAGAYEKTYTGLTSSAAGTIYFKVVQDHDWDVDSWPSSNQTFKINSDSTWVKFSFDPTSHVITVTQDGTGGIYTPEGEWIAGDKYVSGGGTNSNQKVTNTPNIGSNSSSKYFVWGTNDDNVGTDNTARPAISTVANGTSGTIGYWAELTDSIGSNSQFYFALSNNTSNSGIRGNKSEQINCVTKSTGSDVVIYNSEGNQVCKAQTHERSAISGSAYFILLYDFKTDNFTDIAVMAYYNNSNVDYQFYFKDDSSGTGDTETVEKVNIYAKNGALRDNTFNRFTYLADTKILGDDSSYTETGVFEYTEVTSSGVVTYETIKAYNDAHDDDIVITHDVSVYDSNYDKMTNVPVGAKIKLQTILSDNASATNNKSTPEIVTFNNTAFNTTHYLKAYTFNGKTYKVFTPADGVSVTGGTKYTEEWTVESINTAKMKAESGNKVVEVTPIYYMQDASNCKTFYIDGYDGTVQGQWGNMLSIYPYYENKSQRWNAFGGYPGQPMLYWGGKYQMQVPLTDDGTASGAQVKGVTMHNAYWDLLHRDLDTQCSTSNHCQTYDYDDFYKLNKEKNPDSIIFDFKYRTTNDNFNDGYDYTNYTFGGTKGTTTATAATYCGSGYNGVELLTDYFGRQVDVFGNLILDANKSDWRDDDPLTTGTDETNHVQDKELLIVSTGYKDTYVGEYATLWAVYAPSSGNIPAGSDDVANAFIGYISSSMLYLSSLDRRSKYSGGTETSNGRMSWSEFSDTYTHLKTYYTGVPALISYDKEIWNDSKDKANRSDGKWYYSNKDDQISANIKIQYGPASNLKATVDAGDWTDDTFSASNNADTKYIGVGGEHNIGTTTLCSAFFTNESPYLYGKTASGTQFADSDKSFTFEAQANGAYMFAGWVRYSNGKYYEISAKEIAESPMSSNDTYIARFVEAESGTLTIQHVVEKTADYTGSGTPSVTVTVKNGDTTKFTKTVTDGSQIDISSYINTRYRSYTIDISLSTTPGDDCTLHDITSSVGNFSAGTPTLTSGVYNSTVAQFTVQNVLDSGATTLRYVSHLTLATITYNYNITYTYQSRLWGDQSYKVSGTLLSTTPAEALNINGTRNSATLTTEFLTNKTPYEKNFRQRIAWNYAGATYTRSYTGDTYTLNVAVGSTNTIDDTVRAEFMLPYKYDTQANGYKAVKINKYASAGDTAASGEEYVYDEKSYESVSVTGQAYKLFTYDGSTATGGSGTHASYMPLIEAAPYVYKNATIHQNTTNTKKRYLSGGLVTEGDNKFYYFTYNGVRYFYENLPTEHLTTDVALTESDTYTFEGVTYDHALNPTDIGVATTYNDNEDGNAARNAVYYWDRGEAAKGQYCVNHYHYINDGIIEGTGTMKYFTRWDIYNSKGNYVASSYLRFFNYTGYENYIVIPIYESETATAVEGSEATANKVPTITFLGEGRNQWNNGGYGNYDSSWTSGDKLITDYAISFDYYGEQISTIANRTDDPTNGKDIRIGMMIEQLGTLDSAGGKTITDSSYYADKYKSLYTSATISQVETDLASGTNPKTHTGANAIVNIKIASNVSDWGSLFTSSGGNLGNDNTGLAPIDNMNRLQWYYTFNNKKKNTDTYTSDRERVYRASAYLIEVDSSGIKTVTLSTTPVYFTLYDIGSRQLGELS